MKMYMELVEKQARKRAPFMASKLTRNFIRTGHAGNDTPGQLAGDGGIPLRIEGVTKTFSGRMGNVEAIRQIDVDIAAGEFICLFGPSGCGKSTLLSILAGLETASSGTISANNLPVSEPGPDR